MAFSFMKLFPPKDKVFYSLFEEVADNVAKDVKAPDDLCSRTGF